MKAWKERAVELAGLACCLAYHWSVYWPLHRITGLSDDDAWQGSIGLSLVRWLEELARGAGDARPALSWGIHGPLAGYLTAPFLWCFGRSALAMHVCAAVFGSLTLLAAHAAARALFRDRLCALASTALLACWPFFLYATMSPANSDLRVMPFALLALAALAAVHEGGPAWLWPAAGFCLGVALGSHLTFLGWACGLAACAFLCRSRLASRLPSWRMALATAAASLLPLLPFVYGRWQLGAQALPVQSERSYIDLAGAVAERAAQFRMLFGDCLSDFGEDSRFSFFFVWLAVASLGVWWAWRRRRERPLLLWPAALAAVYLVLSCFSPTWLVLFHLLPLLPVLSLAAAAPLVLAPAPARRRGLVVAFALIGALALENVRLSRGLVPAIQATGAGGQQRFELCGWAAAHPTERLAIVTDNPAPYIHQLMFCFDAPRFAPAPAVGDPRGRVNEAAAALLRDPDVTIAVEDLDADTFRAWVSPFETQAAALGLRLRETRRILLSNGRPVLHLYKGEKPGRSAPSVSST